MRLTGNVHILAKIQKPWTDSNGVEKMSHIANIMQNGGEVIDTLRLYLEQFNSIEANKPYQIVADYGVGKNGSYLKLIDITPSKTAN